MIAERNFSCLCFLKTSLKLCNFFFCLFCCSSLRKCCQPWRKLGILQNGMIGAFEPGHHPAGCWWHKILHKRPGLGASLSPLIYSDNCHLRKNPIFPERSEATLVEIFSLKAHPNLPIWRVDHDAGREKEDDLSANQVTLSPFHLLVIPALCLSPSLPSLAKGQYMTIDFCLTLRPDWSKYLVGPFVEELGFNNKSRQLLLS